MVSVLVNVEVKPERLDEFLDVMRKDAEGSRTEPGCLRFDVLQDQENPCKFVFYEVYKNAEAAAEHRDYPHFKLWTDFKVCATGQQASATCLLLPPGRPLHLLPPGRPLHPLFFWQADGVVSSVSSKPKFTPWGFSDA